MKTFWIYTFARFAVLGSSYLVVAFVFFVWPKFFVFSPMTNLAALGVGAVIAAVVSMFALTGVRQRFADEMQARAARISERIEASRTVEDVD